MKEYTPRGDDDCDNEINTNTTIKNNNEILEDLKTKKLKEYLETKKLKDNLQQFNNNYINFSPNKNKNLTNMKLNNYFSNNNNNFIIKNSNYNCKFFNIIFYIHI
jgi:hypothetical protein